MHPQYPDGYHIYFDKFIDNWVAEKDGQIVKSSQSKEEIKNWVKKKLSNSLDLT